MSAPLHLGTTPWLPNVAAAADRIAGQAQAAERFGYDSFWLPESHFIGEASCPQPLLLLAAAAALTERLRLGTTSYLLPIRNPLQVAEELALLDRLSGGRLIVGLGRGFRRTLFEAFEVPIGEKRSRFDRALTLIRTAWSGARIGAGESGWVVAPQPWQKPHPPLWVAAFGPKALQQAGRLGLPYLASPIESFERLEHNYACHGEALREHGHPPADAVPIMRTVFLSEDRETRDVVRAALRQQAAQLRQARPGLAGAQLERIDSWAIVGDRAAVTERLATVRERIGYTHLIVRGHVPGASAEALERSLRDLREIEVPDLVPPAAKG